MSGSHRFRRSQHIRRRRDFACVFAETRAQRGRRLDIRLYLRGEGPPRLGLVVSRRSGNAPRRNRIKRRIREIFRQHPEAFAPGSDLVVLARGHEAATCSFQELETELLELVARARDSGRSRRRGRRG